MKKMSIEKIKVINGGGKLHYHWFCNVNNFRSKRYDTFSAAQKAADDHVATYQSHRYNTYVIECTGNCVN